MPRKKTKPRKRNAKRRPTLAERCDKFWAYEHALQSPEIDVELLQQIYKQARGRKARHLREDFCGSAATLCAWLQQGAKFTGEGYDIDAEVLEWGRATHFAPLGRRARRAELRHADVRVRSARAPDIRCAFNFSYWLFLERREVLEYFRKARADLASDGVFVVDLNGGPEAFSEEEQVTDCGDFELVCHQTGVRPLDHTADLAMHFRFPDGSEMRDAFKYRWRIWSLPEVTDILRDAGFTDIRCHWDIGEEETQYELTRSGHNDPAWIACLAALK